MGRPPGPFSRFTAIPLRPIASGDGIGFQTPLRGLPGIPGSLWPMRFQREDLSIRFPSEWHLRDASASLIPIVPVFRGNKPLSLRVVVSAAMFLLGTASSLAQTFEVNPQSDGKKPVASKSAKPQQAE